MKKISIKSLIKTLTLVLFVGFFIGTTNQVSAKADEVKLSTACFGIRYVSSSYVQIAYKLPYSDITCSVEFADANKNLISTAAPTTKASGVATVYADIKDNKVYYFRIRPVYVDNGTRYYVGPWSGYKAICTVKLKTKLLKKSKLSEKVVLPNVRGVKNAKILISKKKDSGYKKVKTLKPGKSYVITKCGKNKLKKYITYYLKASVKLKDNVPCESVYYNTFRIYTVYR